ncbi:MAG: SurA N-terminal domain-containing protein, partial [Bdellovibrionales bacterium]|nr:SurA N-terminal domain-containing protein [Bdellovibrionales bacterium]
MRIRTFLRFFCSLSIFASFIHGPSLALGIPTVFGVPRALADSILLDGIAASVGGAPITLQEVIARAQLMSSKRGTGESTFVLPKTFSDAGRDPAVQSALEQLIAERLLKLEAKERRVDVSSEEIDRYLDRVAQQNNLTRDEFFSALQSEGRSLDQYKKQVELDILRTKLAGSIVREGVSVSEKEIDEYLEEKSDLSS